MAVTLLVFLLLMDNAQERDDLAAWDWPLLSAILPHRDGLLTTFFVAVTNIGSGVGLFVVAALVSGFVAVRRRSAWPMVITAATILGSVAVNNAVKVVVHRPRPAAQYWLAHPSGYAFPSGHSMNSAAAYGILAFLVCQLTRVAWKRVLVAVAAAALVAAIGFSRIYLGVHWFTDVVAGLTAGVGWLLLVLAVARLWPTTADGDEHTA